MSEPLDLLGKLDKARRLVANGELTRREQAWIERALDLTAVGTTGSRLADILLHALRFAADDNLELSLSNLHSVASNNRTATEIRAALRVLAERGLAASRREGGGRGRGQPLTLWRAMW